MEIAKRALISVSDKTGVDVFAKGLCELGFEIVSTGGTARFLREKGVSVTDISDVTDFPEMMEGRVKTLHPKVHGGLLCRPDNVEDQKSMMEHGISPIELVVCNFYPFEKTVASGADSAACVENIDIGGPAMVRSASKNFAHVTVLTEPGQYDSVLEALRKGLMPLGMRRAFAAIAFEKVALYDRAIADYMHQLAAETEPSTSVQFPTILKLVFRKEKMLRYGENPHQQAALYIQNDAPEASLGRSEQIHGKELSFNNLGDLDAAFHLIREFEESPAVVVLKHKNPCGAGVAATQEEAFALAYEGDPVSAFGSVMGFNRPVGIDVAKQLCLPNRFVECIIAPDFDPEAFEMLTKVPKWKDSIRLLKCPAMSSTPVVTRDFQCISGGLLVQQSDHEPDPQDEWKTVTHTFPLPQELKDLLFAWKICKHVKSNAIVFAKNRQLVGVGAGQMSRVDSVWMASRKAGERSKGAVVASDAFFPFKDGPELAVEAGITAIIQPGGSRNDAETIKVCNEHNVAMIFTGRRHFRH